MAKDKDKPKGKDKDNDKPKTKAPKRTSRKSLLPREERADATNLSDVFLIVAGSVEDALVRSGARPGKDYRQIDLFKLAEPFVLSIFNDKTRDHRVELSRPAKDAASDELAGG